MRTKTQRGRSFAIGYLGETSQITARQLSSSNVETSWSYLSNVGDRRLAGIDNTGVSTGQYSDFSYESMPEGLISGIGTSSDAAGATPTDGIVLAHYNDLNQLTRMAGEPRTYDNNGNLLSDGSRSYAWDAENRLVGITYPGVSGKATAFTYDGLGRRTTIGNTPAGGGSAVATSYVWCGTELCQARDAGNAVTREYLNEGEYVPGSPAQPYGIDQIGSVRRAFASVTSAPAYDYDPYGVPLQASAPVTDFTYAGLFHEAGSGLDLALYRAYDPVAGRWLSRDPLGEESDLAANLYDYVGGSPVAFIDPMGLFNILVGAGATAAGGPAGAEGSGGIAVNPGFFGQQADVGIFGAAGVTAGLNISSDVFVGYVAGGIENVRGGTINQNFGILNISLTTFHDPHTGALIGGTLGFGPGVTQYSYSGAYENTALYTIRDLIHWLISGPCG